MIRKTTILTSFLLALMFVAPATVSVTTADAQRPSQGRPGREVYRGTIFYIGGPRTFTDFFTLTIDSYTPDAEVQRLTGVLGREGQDDFWRTVTKEKRGSIQIGSRLARDINAVWVSQTDEGRKISALAERWMQFGEIRRGGRSVDYPFTYIELWVQQDGDVEGSLFPAARLRSKGNNTIEVENFGIYPARLTNVKQRRR
jgi:hypothetical protein